MKLPLGGEEQTKLCCVSGSTHSSFLFCCTPGPGFAISRLCLLPVAMVNQVFAQIWPLLIHVIFRNFNISWLSLCDPGLFFVLCFLSSIMYTLIRLQLLFSGRLPVLGNVSSSRMQFCNVQISVRLKTLILIEISVNVLWCCKWIWRCFS